MFDARQYFSLPSPSPMHRGGELLGAVLAYETWGSLNAAKSNALMLFTGMSPGAHASSNADASAGWWEDMVGPGKPIDTQRWFVICANSLGSCKGSTGPASVDPKRHQPYRMGFPELCIEDIAAANYALQVHLGISQLHAAVGCSMGGMSVLAHAALHPGASKHAILISTAMRAEPFAIAIRSVQRQLVMADPHFQGGAYCASIDVQSGMGLARKLGVISYRSADEWRARFARQRVEKPLSAAFATEFEVERYLDGHAARWAGSFDPCSYVYLSRAMDWFDLSQHAALPIFDRALVIGVASDILFPLSQQRELASALRSAGAQTQLCELPSLQGHDAFLVDMENFGPLVARFLAQSA
jgi:homoserine O-acetyltransferase/O-succinyltransferase